MFLQGDAGLQGPLGVAGERVRKYVCLLYILLVLKRAVLLLLTMPTTRSYSLQKLRNYL